MYEFTETGVSMHNTHTGSDQTQPGHRKGEVDTNHIPNQEVRDTC